MNGLGVVLYNSFFVLWNVQKIGNDYRFLALELKKNYNIYTEQKGVSYYEKGT